MRLPAPQPQPLLLIALAVLAVLAPAPLGAQSEELLAAREEFRRLYEDGRYAEAEPVALEALELSEREFGPDHPEVAIALNDLASLDWTLNRSDEAEGRYRRAREILADAPGDYRVMALGVLQNLTVLLDERGDWGQVEELYLEALALIEQEHGRSSALYASACGNLGAFYQVQGRHQEAEERLRESLEIKRQVLEPDDPSIAVGLSNLANLFEIQGREELALEFNEQALEARQRALGDSHPEVAFSLDKLGGIYRSRRNFRKAHKYYDRALAIYRDTLPADHPRVTTVLRSLAALRLDEGQYDEAEAAYEELLAIRRASGPRFPQIPTALIDLGNLNWHRGTYAAAEPHYREALEIQREFLPAGHPEIALSLNNLANLYYAQGEFGPALEHSRQAVAIHRARAARFTGREQGVLSEQRKHRDAFLLHVLATFGAMSAEPARRDELVAEGFESGQLAHATSTAAAVARMATRFAAAGDALGRLVRERQDAVEERRELDERLLAALALPPEERGLAALAERAAAMDGRIDGLDAELRERFPEYAEMVGQRPQPLSEIQRQLGDDEALVAFAVWGDRTFVWGVRRDRVHAFFAMLGEQELRRAVRKLRRGLKVADSRAPLPEFDTATAHDLHDRLLAPLAEVLTGASHLFVVPDGPLTGLPLGLLVTDASAQPQSPAGYREVAWLSRRYPITVLPAASSLTALRLFARKTPGSRPFLGVGDPLLEGDAGAEVGLEELPDEEDGSGVDPARLRRLARLPDSADELEQIARLLGVAPEESLYLGARASESTVRALPLAEYRIVQFATHGLVTGELGVSEPALVLTPPERASAADDGLLYASEIAQLDLHADWVVLSACNTAAGDAAGADGLSGLAKAFFYAGSRTLLVSHWPVSSQAAVQLTTGMFAELTADPGIGRAEALRRSMMALMADDAYAHPLFWAPFEVVGDGGPAAPEPDSAADPAP